MTTNINENLLIVTPQRNANTLVQGSAIASSNGPLSELLNNQAVRTVKGALVFPATGGSGTGVVLNNYDGSPLCFTPGDVVIAMTLANGSSVYSGSSPYNFPNSFTGTSSTITAQFKTALLPEFNPATQLWEAGTSKEALTAAINLTELYPQPGTPPTYGSNPPVALNLTLSKNTGIGTQGLDSGNVQATWMNCEYVGIPSNVGNFYGVNVTMLVINPNLAQ